MNSNQSRLNRSHSGPKRKPHQVKPSLMKTMPSARSSRSGRACPVHARCKRSSAFRVRGLTSELSFGRWDLARVFSSIVMACRRARANPLKQLSAI